MQFVKMHGAGNDYLYVNCFAQRVDDPVWLARKVSVRHFGIGADGLVLICAHGHLQRGRVAGENVRERGTVRGKIRVRARARVRRVHDAGNA